MAKARPHYGEFRRQLTQEELACCFDFAGHQRGWKAAVDSAVTDWSGIAAQWRSEIRAQLSHGAPETALDQMHLDTDHAADTLYARLVKVAEQAGRTQEQAAARQGVHVPQWDLDEGVTAALAGRSFLRTLANSTAANLASRLVSSARGQATKLSRVFSGPRLASEVDQFLADLSDAYAREGLGGAVSAAQGTGQLAVLRAAPPATYTASELLDGNTCQPCAAVDGKTFSSLADAEHYYPAGGYVDCLGGSRCRGQIIATWDQGLLASIEGVSMTSTEELGGKPNQGTPKDKRLTENKRRAQRMATAGAAPCGECPDDADHFALHETGVSVFGWDGAASRFTDPQYQEASAACDPGDGTVKERCFLPHHDPSGALNRDGLAAAAARVSTLKGHDPAAVARAKAHLRSHYSKLDLPVPDSLKADAAVDTFAISCPDGWKPDPDGDGCVPADWSPGDAVPKCPPGMTRDPDADGCVPVKSASMSAQTAAPAVAPTDQEMGGQTAPWNGVLAVEGVTTGDGREFAPGALTWRELPIPLRWNMEDSHGGEPRTVAVNVGRIDTIDRVGNELRATGVFNLGSENGRQAYDLVKGNFLRGVSIDADSIAAPDVEVVLPQGAGDDPDADIFDLLFQQPEKVIYHGGRISAATLCDIPAFAEAYVALTADDGTVIASGRMEPEEWELAQSERGRDVLTAAALMVVDTPPADWFQDPQLSLPTPITIDAAGRVYGHAALWGTCHIGQAGACVTPPREDSHPYYMTGEVLTSDGQSVSVGQITVGTGHAPITASRQAAAEHYDNTGAAVADVAVGNDAHGIWVAGAIRPDASPSQVAALRSAGQVSGDWRRVGGKLRLVGLLAVNVPGFPVPKTRTRMNDGQQFALVAAGLPSVAPGSQLTLRLESSPSEEEMRRAMEALARKVNGKDN